MGAGFLYAKLQDRGQDGLLIKGTHFQTEVMTSDADMARGLSGRDSIGSNNAMVFDFAKSSNQCFWMKDMKFPIDMVWVDEVGKVTATERNVQPSTYPENFCHTGKKVIEFAAGTADRLPLYIGDKTE